MPFADRGTQARGWLSDSEWWTFDGADAVCQWFELTTAMRQADAEYDTVVQHIGAGSHPVCESLDPLERSGDVFMSGSV